MSDYVAFAAPHVSGARAVRRRVRWLLAVVVATGVLSACGGSAVEDTADGLVATSSGSTVGILFWILAGAVPAITGVVLLRRLMRHGWTRLRNPDRRSQKQAMVDGADKAGSEARRLSVRRGLLSVIGIIALFVIAAALWWYPPRIEVRVNLDRSAGWVTLTHDYLLRDDRTRQIAVQDLVLVQVHYGRGNSGEFGRVTLASPDQRIEWEFSAGAAGELARAVARAAPVELVETRD